MSRRYRFDLTSDDPRMRLPEKVMVGMKSGETEAHVLLKGIGFAICYRDRMEIEKKIPRDDVLFVPDLVQFDYRLEVAFWGECGDCSVDKLNKLAVKAPEAEIWVLKKSKNEADDLLVKMRKAGLRKGRYKVASFNVDDFMEILQLQKPKNSLYLCQMDWEMRQLQMEFNRLWFDIQLNLEEL